MSRGATEAKIIGWKEDKNSDQLLAKVGTEMAQISGDEVSATSFDSRQKDGDVFLGQVDSPRQFARRWVEQIEILGKPLKSAKLCVFGEVDSRFFQGITGSAEQNSGKLPEPQETGVRTIGSGE
jgi:hypothetical protein